MVKTGAVGRKFSCTVFTLRSMYVGKCFGAAGWSGAVGYTAAVTGIEFGAQPWQHD